MRQFLSSRITSLVCWLLILIPAGILAKHSHFSGSAWVNNHLVGVLYVIAWCLAIALICQRSRPLLICSGVFAMTCLIEFSQAWQAQVLSDIRTHWLGQILLGNSFDWLDFPHYLLGAALAYAMLRYHQVKPGAT